MRCGFELPSFELPFTGVLAPVPGTTSGTARSWPAKDGSRCRPAGLTFRYTIACISSFVFRGLSLLVVPLLAASFAVGIAVCCCCDEGLCGRVVVPTCDALVGAHVLTCAVSAPAAVLLWFILLVSACCLVFAAPGSPLWVGSTRFLPAHSLSAGGFLCCLRCTCVAARSCPCSSPPSPRCVLRYGFLPCRRCFLQSTRFLAGARSCVECVCFLIPDYACSRALRCPVSCFACECHSLAILAELTLIAQSAGGDASESVPAAGGPGRQPQRVRYFRSMAAVPASVCPNGSLCVSCPAFSLPRLRRGLIHVGHCVSVLAQRRLAVLGRRPLAADRQERADCAVPSLGRHL